MKIKLRRYQFLLLAVVGFILTAILVTNPGIAIGLAVLLWFWILTYRSI